VRVPSGIPFVVIPNSFSVAKAPQEHVTMASSGMCSGSPLILRVFPSFFVDEIVPSAVQRSWEGEAMDRQRVTFRGGLRCCISILLALAAAGYTSAVLAGSDPSIPPGFLAYPPYNNFEFEATHLFPARHDDLNVVEDRVDAYQIQRELLSNSPQKWTDDSRRREAKLTAVPDQLKAEFKAMQSAANGDAAYAVGKDLPEAIRLYTAAAVDFHIAHPTVTPWGTWSSPPAPGPLDTQQRAALGAAITRFQAVLGLSDAEKVPRAAAAAYMLGRSYALRALPGDLPEAEKAFVLTRTMARNGLPDPDGLAVASFGEQARLRRAQGDLASTVDLYAEQAVRGSAEGVDSLKWVAQALYDDPEGMAKAEYLPRVQRVLIAYALDVNDDGRVLDYTYVPGAVSFNNILNRPAGITPILQIAKRWPREAIAWPDRLAALAYRSGDTEFARSLIGDQDSALAWWIRAKLLIADGKLAEAEKAYHKVVEEPSRPDDLGRLTSFNGAGACAELVQLERVRGEFIQAMHDKLTCNPKYDDVGFGMRTEALAYMAERVLTTKELKDFVDALPQIPNSKTLFSGAKFGRSELRSELAKRLVREGRAAEAVPYADIELDRSGIPEPIDTGLSKNLKTQHDLIQAYQVAQRQSEHAASAIDQAAAWYQLALLTRIYYYVITGHDSPIYKEEAKPEFPGVSNSELVRLKSNYTSPDQDNLHWYIAYDDALKAAQLVPARSQAYAAILCHAAHWMYQAPPVGEHDPSSAFQAAWRLYLKNGAYVPWAKSFGRRCPDPDFDEASRPTWQREMNTFHVRLNRHPLVAAALLVLLLLGIIVTVGLRVRTSRRLSQ
jgi:cellulose synthase operon protein C